MTQIKLIELQIENTKQLLKEISEKINATNDTASKEALSNTHKDTLEKLIELNDKLKKLKNSLP